MSHETSEVTNKHSLISFQDLNFVSELLFENERLKLSNIMDLKLSDTLNSVFTKTVSEIKKFKISEIIRKDLSSKIGVSFGDSI